MSFDGFDEVMPLTDNTQIVTNDKGLILNDPLDLSMTDYNDEFEFIPPADEVTDEYINKTKEEVDKMLAMVRPRITLAEDNKKKSILNKMLFWK